jgi:hypothetical protein
MAMIEESSLENLYEPNHRLCSWMWPILN